MYTYNYTGLKAKLAESGIRYVRDGTFPAVFVRANDLYDSLGVKTDMLTGRFKSGPWPQPLDPTQIDAELNEIKNQSLAATVSLEAPNEYDLSHGPDTDWVGTIKNYSMLLYTKAKADAMLKNLPVIGPSLTSLEAYEAVGNSDSYIDYGNQHLYQWTFWPGFDGLDKNGSRSITWYLDDLARQQSPSGKHVQGTEAGYTDYVETGGLSEEADGKYMARIYAEFFRRGIDRTYKYEFVNQGQPGREGLFGLLRNDLSEKPSFRAVKNLITILSDKGPTFELDTLNYILGGNTTDVHQILFQKRNGDFYLMIWMEISSWDVNAKTDLYPLPQQLTLTLQDSNRISNASLYAFNNTADVDISNLTINNNQIIFNVTDKISIVKLSNGTATSIPYGLYQLIPKSALGSSLASIVDDKYAVVIQSQYWSDLKQQWIIKSEGNDFYRLINRNSDQVLVSDSCTTNTGDIMRLGDWSDSDCQKWKFDLLSNGYYRIIPMHAQDQCLDVQQCSSTDRTKVQPRSCLNIDSQYWKLKWIVPLI